MRSPAALTWSATTTASSEATKVSEYCRYQRRAPSDGAMWITGIIKRPAITAPIQRLTASSAIASTPRPSSAFLCQEWLPAPPFWLCQPTARTLR